MRNIQESYSRDTIFSNCTHYWTAKKVLYWESICFQEELLFTLNKIGKHFQVKFWRNLHVTLNFDYYTQLLLQFYYLGQMEDSQMVNRVKSTETFLVHNTHSFLSPISPNICKLWNLFPLIQNDTIIKYVLK